MKEKEVKSSLVKRVGLKLLKYSLRLIAALLMVIIALFLVLQLPASQSYLTGKLEKFLQDKLNTKVEIDEINIEFPKSIVLGNIYVEDLKNDTLWYSKKIVLDVNVRELFNEKVVVNYFLLEGVNAKVIRKPGDSTYNFQFVPDAFASKEKVSEISSDQLKEETPGNWEIQAHNFHLKNIQFSFDDYLMGLKSSGKIGAFDLNQLIFNTATNSLKVDGIALDNCFANTVKYAESKILSETDTSASSNLTIDLGLLNLHSVSAGYEDVLVKTASNIHIDSFDIKAAKVDMASYSIDVGSISLNNSLVSQIQHVSDTNLVAEPVQTDSSALSISFPWKITLNKLNIGNQSVKVINKNYEEKINGIDFNNMIINGLNISLKEVLITDKNIKTQIENIKFEEKSGLALNSFKTTIFITDTSAVINDLEMVTPNSTLKNNLSLRYKSLGHFMANPYEAFLEQTLYDAEIGLKDAIFFSPELKDQPFFLQQPFKLRTAANGKIKDLKVDSFYLSGLKNTMVKLEGSVKGLPDMDSLVFALNLKKFKTTKGDLQKISPSLLTSEVNLPQEINGKLKVWGSLDKVKSEATILTSLGKVEYKGSFAQPKKQPAQYQANLQIVDFNLGKLLNKQKELGTLTLGLNMSGQNLDSKLMVAQAKAKLEKIEFNGYTYKNIGLDFSANRQVFLGTVAMDEKDLAFNLTLNFNEKIEAAQINLALKTVQLKALGFSSEPVEIDGKMAASVQGMDVNNLVGRLSFESVGFRKVKDYQVIKMLDIKLKSDQTGTDLQLVSDLVNGNYKSNFSLGKSTEVFNQQLAPYFNLNDTSFVDTSLCYFNFNFEIPQPELLKETLIPELKKIRLSKFNGGYSNKTKQLFVEIDMPELDYADVKMDSFKLKLTTEKQGVVYSIRSKKIKHPSFLVNYPDLGGKIENNVVWSQLAVSDADKREKFRINTTLEKVDSGFSLKLKEEELLLNFEKWLVNPSNHLFFNNHEVTAHKFQISNNSQLFGIEGEGVKESPLSIKFENFDIATFARLVEQDTNSLISGKIDGLISIEELFEEPKLALDVTVHDFSYGDDTLGGVHLQASNAIKDQFDFKMDINSKTNKAQGKGFYRPKTDSVLVKLDMPNFQLSTIEPYMAGQLKEMSGSINGNLLVNGTLANPNINGKINFVKAAMRVTQTNGYYLLNNEAINFSNNKIVFNGFKILDKKKNASEINGSIVLEKTDQFLLDLKVEANNFQILNTTKKDNNSYYGKLALKTNLKIKGSSQEPKITAALKILEGSDLTFVVPEEEEATFEYDGLMEFVDFDSLNNIPDSITLKSDTVIPSFTGIDLNASLEIDKNVKFKIIIDPSAGDNLEIIGKSVLSFSIDPTGKMTLSGNYEISEGTYELTYYNLLKRSFTIQPGSNIAWNGDPLNANLNIKTKYIVKTAPAPIMSSQTNASGSEAVNPYKKSLPFEVMLNVRNEMMKPEIDFELALPDEHKSFQGGVVQAKLVQLNQQPSELNKQVFSLLMLNRFIPETSQSGASGGGLSSSARSSVSKMISQQLNALSGKYIKGVELNFDLESYNDNTGAKPQGRTELKLELSKELFNEKLIVSLGGNFDLEGENKSQNSVGNLAQDVSFEYKISENGTYRLKGYRKNQYEGVIDGDLTKTGVAFIFTRDYNKLNELFKKKKKGKNKQ